MENAELKMDNADCMLEPAPRHGMVGFGNHADGLRHDMTLVHIILSTSCFLLRLFDIPANIPYSALSSTGEDMFRMMTAIVTKKQVKRVKQPDQRSG